MAITVKKLARELARIINESGEFVAYTNQDPDFQLEDQDVAVAGEPDEIFYFTVRKVED